MSKGFHIACDDLKVKRKFVIYSGEDQFMMNDKIEAISLPLFMALIQKELK